MRTYYRSHELLQLAPTFNLNDIDDLDGTVKLLRHAEIL